MSAGQLAGLELRHRQHARVEDRIRQAKATGRPNLPFNAFDANAAWLEIVMAAIDLVAWAKLIGFTGHPELACCEIETFRYPVFHAAARITRGGRSPTAAPYRRHLALGPGDRHRLAGYPRCVHLTENPGPDETKGPRP